jgi:hypothetical protein
LGYGRLGPRVEAFLGSRGSPCSRMRAHRQLSGSCTVDLPAVRPTALDVVNHRHAGLPSCVTPVNTLTYYRIRSQPDSRPSPKEVDACPGGESHRARYGRSFAGTGISTRRPSTTPVGLALGPDLPRADEPGPGTLGHSADGFLTRLSLLMPAFSLVPAPPLGHPAASPPARRSPTHPHTWAPPKRAGPG